MYGLKFIKQAKSGQILIVQNEIERKFYCSMFVRVINLNLLPPDWC